MLCDYELVNSNCLWKQTVTEWLARTWLNSCSVICRVGIVGEGGWTPSSCLQTPIFEWKSALNFNPWAKFQTFRQLTPSSFRSFQHWSIVHQPVTASVTHYISRRPNRRTSLLCDAVFGIAPASHFWRVVDQAYTAWCWYCHCQRSRPSSRCHDLVGP